MVTRIKGSSKRPRAASCRGTRSKNAGAKTSQGHYQQVSSKNTACLAFPAQRKPMRQALPLHARAAARRAQCELAQGRAGRLLASRKAPVKGRACSRRRKRCCGLEPGARGGGLPRVSDSGLDALAAPLARRPRALHFVLLVVLHAHGRSSHGARARTQVIHAGRPQRQAARAASSHQLRRPTAEAPRRTESRSRHVISGR